MKKILFKVLAKLNSLKINWIKPDLKEELGEYFENTFTKHWLKKQNIEFKDDKQLLNYLQQGKLTSLTKSDLKNAINFTIDPTEFEKEIQDLEYRKSFKDMEDTLLKNKEITLPAPIVLKINDTLYSFSGNRRLNLAWKYNLPVKVWFKF